MELIKAIFGLITDLAWPVAVVLIVWWFQEEIAELIRRGFKFKGYGVEIEAQEILKKVEAEIRPEAIEQVKEVHIGAKSTSSASVQVRLLEGVNLLMDRATSDPRNAMKRSWELLGGAVLLRANVSGENVQPDSEEIATSLKRLEASTQYSGGLDSLN